VKNNTLWDVMRFVVEVRQQGSEGKGRYPSIKLHGLSFRKNVTYEMNVMGTANPSLIKDFIGDVRSVSQAPLAHETETWGLVTMVTRKDCNN
jgi:hypothetical protein